LLAVAHLEKRGKLFNKNGFFFVQDQVFLEMCNNRA
jgi:hypothetical protein